MSAPPDDDISPKTAASPRWFGICLALLCGIFLILGLRAALSASPTTDEPGHYRYGHRILRGVAERWDDSKMPVSALNALPCYVLEKSGSSVRDLDEDHGPCDWTLARIPTLLGGLVLGLAVASWSKALFGWPGALVSFGLFAADPNLIAHSSLVTTDVLGALFLLLSLRAFALWLEEPKPKNSVLLGLSVGGAFVSKYTAAYLLIIFIVATWLARKTLASGSAGRRRAPGLALAIVIALLAINVGFLGDGTGTSLRDQRFESPQFRELRKVPILASLPLPVPRPFIEGLDRVFHRERSGGGSGNLYFMGELRTPGSEGFVSYFLVIGLLKTPLPAIAALIMAAVLWGLRRDDRPLGAQEITLLSAVFLFAVYFSFLFRAQIGLRHFLVVFPPLYILAGKLGSFLSQSRTRAALGAIGLALSLISVIRHGDDPLSYFNELVEPTRTYRIAADSNLEWGQTRGRIDSYLAAHPEVLNAPAQPFPGRILVGANQLTGVVMRKRMEWLRQSGIEPVGHVAFTHFLFDVSEAEALRLRRGRAERGAEPPL
jgi:hypothetical protein